MRYSRIGICEETRAEESKMTKDTQTLTNHNHPEKREAMPQIIGLSCSWCYEMNGVEGALEQGRAVYCCACQHRADVLREVCDCRSCIENKRLIELRERGRASWPNQEQQIEKVKRKPRPSSEQRLRRMRRFWRNHKAHTLILLLILLVSSIATWIIAGR